MEYPILDAHKLARAMRKFRAATEETAHSEENYHADHDRAEVVRQIDWLQFAQVIEQLEFCYQQQKIYGRD